MAKQKIVRTSAGLCDALFEELDMLRNGESNALRAGAVSKLAVQIINTKKLELEASQLNKSGVKARTLQLNNSIKLGGS